MQTIEKHISISDDISTNRKYISGIDVMQITNIAPKGQLNARHSKGGAMPSQKLEPVNLIEMGKRLVFYREKRGYDQKDMPRIVHKSDRQIRDYEKGKTPIPSDTLALWSQACKVSTDHFLYGEGPGYIDPATQARLAELVNRYRDKERPAFGSLIRRFLLTEDESTLYFIEDLLELKANRGYSLNLRTLPLDTAQDED